MLMPVTLIDVVTVEESVLILLEKIANEPLVTAKPVTVFCVAQLVIVLPEIFPAPLVTCISEIEDVLPVTLLNVLLVIFFVGTAALPSPLNQPPKVIAPVMVILEKLLPSLVIVAPATELPMS